MATGIRIRREIYRCWARPTEIAVREKRRITIAKRDTHLARKFCSYNDIFRNILQLQRHIYLHGVSFLKRLEAPEGSRQS